MSETIAKAGEKRGMEWDTWKVRRWRQRLAVKR